MTGKNIKYGVIALWPFLFLLGGCGKNAIDKLVNPTISNTSGVWSGQWVVYDDEIKTNGTIMSFTTPDGQDLDFNFQDTPHGGTKCIKFSWDGSPVTEYSNGLLEHDFVGFSFIAADSINKYDAAAKDLTAGAYTRVSFWVRGSLNSNVYLRLEANNADYRTSSGTNAWLSNTTDRRITANWQKYEFALAGSLANTKDFVRIILRYDEDGDPDSANGSRGNGGTVYLDDIELLR